MSGKTQDWEHRYVAPRSKTLESSLQPRPDQDSVEVYPKSSSTQAQLLNQAVIVLVSSGMRELGYRYVEIQECIAPARDKQGNLVVDSKRFPHGMKPLIDYIHSRGLKAGIYTDVGPYTCYERENEHYAGSFEHEDQDAATFASWGIDFIFEDYCNKPDAHTGRELYERMASAIHKTGRPMILYICSWGNENPWIWGHEVGQVWRTDSDL